MGPGYYDNVPSNNRRDASLARRLTIAIATPTLLLLGVGTILTIQIVRMTENARWVEHSDSVIAKLYELQTQVLSQETALRGYLLSGDSAQLSEYRTNKPNETAVELRELVSDSVDQTLRANIIRERYAAWSAAASLAFEPDETPESLANPDVMADRRTKMSLLREAINRMLVAETTIQHDRSAAAQNTNRLTFYLTLPLLLALGIALAFVSRRQLRTFAKSYEDVLDAEAVTLARVENQNWVRTEQVSLSFELQGDMPIERLGSIAISHIAKSTGAVVGAFYVAGNGVWRRAAGYALAADAPTSFAPGEGLVGQAALSENLLQVHDVPPGHLRVRSGASDGDASSVLLIPARVDKVTLAVIELGFFNVPGARAVELCERIGESVAYALQSTTQKIRLRELLEESQAQSEELQSQHEELRVANEELQEQGDALRSAQALLEERREELEASNASLAAQRDALGAAQVALAEQTREIQRASRYKSEFLANMSHELRTPLNSILILAKLLADNRDQNLIPDQVRFAKTIYSSGNDLLALINDVLDISKIEAGRLDVEPTQATLGQLIDPVARTFEPIATQKNLTLNIEADERKTIVETDVRRVHQILKNFLSNAFKFTDSGGVTLSAKLTVDSICLRVTDTGVGIADDKLQIIFEPFRQADGGVTRKFGGTGLGLSISRELAELLGGKVTVTSELGKGSTFELIIPRVLKPTPAVARKAVPASLPPIARSAREEPSVPLNSARRLLLVVDDDERFAGTIMDLARELDFEVLHGQTADQGVRLAARYSPAAIVLNINPSDNSGIAALDQLKRDSKTRHIPVHIVSEEDHSATVRAMGAIGSMVKPVARDDLARVLREMAALTSRTRKLLIVEDDDVERDAVSRLLSGPRVEIVAVDSVSAGLAKLRADTFDCVVTDLGLADGSGLQMLETMANDDAYSFPPVVVYTGRSVTSEEELRLRRYSQSIIVKGVQSPERLLDEVTLFLHQVESELPPERQRMLKNVRDRDASLEGRTILIAEDDVRNIFALSHVLEPFGAKLVIARNGLEAVAAIHTNPKIDLVLMDIMMPEMDGLEAIREIRKDTERFSRLPIIALTAKAMPDDQATCLQAGASDYLAKPLDVTKLLSLIRVWLRS